MAGKHKGREKAAELATQGELSIKEIATEVEASERSVHRWAKEDGWQVQHNKNFSAHKRSQLEMVRAASELQHFEMLLQQQINNNELAAMLRNLGVEAARLLTPYQVAENPKLLEIVLKAVTDLGKASKDFSELLKAEESAAGEEALTPAQVHAVLAERGYEIKKVDTTTER